MPLFLQLVACYGGERASTGQCPAGETCSTETPYGLHFIGDTMVDDLLLTGPAPTAVGGTQDVALQYDRGDDVLIALDLPFTADDGGGLGVTIDHTTGSVVTVRGASSASNYLRILDASDGTLFDRKELTGAAIDTIALVATDFENIPDGSLLAWATGDQQIGVALFGQVQEATGPTDERIIDTSMQVSLAGASRTAWDTLHVPTATVGTSTLQVTAGDQPAANLDFVVVDHADTIGTIDPTPSTIMTNGQTQVCFSASAAGRYVVGLDWGFVIDGVPYAQGSDALERNCVTASTQKTSGTVTVQAMAGGQMMSIALTVGAAARPIPAHAGSSRPTAGDRAAM